MYVQKVNSGRRETLSPDLSSKTYISLSTTSVVCPNDFENKFEDLDKAFDVACHDKANACKVMLTF